MSEDELALELAAVSLPSDLLIEMLGKAERSMAETIAAISQFPHPDLADMADHLERLATAMRAELARRTIDAAEQMTDDEQ